MIQEDKIKIIGGTPLKGTVSIHGAKNSALPIIVSSILCDGELTLKNIPNLSDVKTIFDILLELNCKVDFSDNIAKISGHYINNHTSSYELGSKMRASILILGPLLARFHKAKVSLPGGCSIGSRPVDMHVSALEKMGAQIRIEHGYIVAEAKDGLQGTDITFEKVSVGATENILMAATLAKGITKIINASKEPEIKDLANCLITMGAKIKGAGTSLIEIEGVAELISSEYTIIADRIEAGSYAIATAATKGDVILTNVSREIFGIFFDTLEEVGIGVQYLENAIRVFYKGEIKPVDVTTLPFPNFPTDLQSLWMTLMCLADGKSIIDEQIFENRYNHVPQLLRMGADIKIKDHVIAIIDGIKEFSSAEVEATDLRSAFALIIAGLTAKKETQITQLFHLDRGYVDAVAKLSSLGANIRRGVDI